MKRSAERKARLTVIGFIHTSLISMLSLFIFSSPGYGGTDIPVNVTTAPVPIEEAALFADLGAESGPASQGDITAVNPDISSTAISTLLAELQEEEAVYTEKKLDIEPLNGTELTAHLPCEKNSCSL